MDAITENTVIPKLRFKEFNDNWQQKTLEDFGKLINGLTYSPNDITDDGVLVLRSSNIQNNQLAFDDNVFVNVKSFNPVKENDILICVRNGSKRLIGKNCLIDKGCEGVAFGAFMTIYRSPNNNFIFYLFSHSSYYRTIHQNLGATINSINNNDFKKFKFFFPSHPEQKKIASFLTSVDDKLNQLTKKKKLLKEYKKGMMQKIFSQELRFKDDNGNNYPDWEEDKLKELVSTPISDGPHLTPKFIKDGVPFLSVNNIVNNKIDLKNIRKISFEDHLEFSKKCKPIKNDLLLGKAASVGKIAIVETDIEFNIWSPLAMIRIKKSYISKYFYYCFQTQVLQKRIKKFINSSSQGNIGMGDIGKLIFEFPNSKEEQQKIANFLSSIDNKIDLVSIQIKNTKSFKKGLLQQMLV